MCIILILSVVLKGFFSKFGEMKSNFLIPKQEAYMLVQLFYVLYLPGDCFCPEKGLNGAISKIKSLMGENLIKFFFLFKETQHLLLSSLILQI